MNLERESMIGLNRIRLTRPLDGPVVPIESVPDEVFAQRIVGDGIAIDPTSSVLKAPVSGTVIQLHSAGHALTIATQEGVEILLHIGIDTVKLKGNGFTPLVKSGDIVSQGQGLIRFNSDEVGQRAKSLISMMIIAEPKGFELVKSTQGFFDLIPKSSLPKKSANQSGEPVRSDEIRVLLKTGLHARPAGRIATQARRYEFPIDIVKDGRRANAKSVVAIMALEIQYGDRIHFEGQGESATQAVESLANYLETIEEPAEEKTESVQASQTTEKMIGGVAAAPGVTVGRIYQLSSKLIEIEERSNSTPSEEMSRLQAAVRIAQDELKSLSLQMNKDQSAIFTAHQDLLEDPDTLEETQKQIREGKSAEFSFNFAINKQIERLSRLRNELMAQRTLDLKDVGHRVLRILSGQAQSIDQIPEGSILIAETLTPSQTASFDRKSVLGFATLAGGTTSHVAILARSLGIPAVVGAHAKALLLANGQEVILDGDRGVIELSPSAEDIAMVRREQTEQARKREVALQRAHDLAITKDDHRIEVAANIGGVADAQKAVELGGEGVGLLRSEFLFLNRTQPPTEEEQFQVYQQIADVLQDRPLTIRTLDVGGDKPLQYLPIPHEENPFLGVRGLRVGFLHPEVFREQLRAILRVKKKGPLNVMFPMVFDIEEFRLAKQMLEEEREKLGVEKVPVGIMVEVPSAALTAEEFAKECDFFSIGTNDLTQYTLAMDRGHKDLAKQVDGLHPAVLKLIAMTVKAAHKYDRWVGVCGGIAGDAKAVPILVGLGVDELSVSLPSIPMVKAQVRELEFSATEKLADRALAASNAKTVRELT